MAEPYSGPALPDIRKNLADLVTDGLVPYNIAEKGGTLLELEIVRSQVAGDPDADDDETEAALATALESVLQDAVNKERMPIRRYRRVLKNVLPLKDELIGKPINERRATAAQDLKDGKAPVKPGTIRTYYEPRALDDLARVLIEMEAEHRGQRPDASP
jgi:hypothetical protein